MLSLISLNSNSQNIESEIIQLKEKIAQREMLLPSLKKGELSDSLLNQISDYKVLTRLLSDTLMCISKKGSIDEVHYSAFQKLTSNKVEIFDEELDALSNEVPECLIEHYSIIKNIAILKKLIESIEERANSLKEQLSDVDQETLNNVIRAKIEKDVSTAQALIRTIKESNMSTLSAQQKDFFKPFLTERYNKFSIYFK